MTEKAIIIGLAAIAFFWSLRNWRDAVKAALVLLVVEGAIRKWLVPGSQQLVYFGKDVVLLGAYLGFFNDTAAKRYRIPAPPALLLLVTLAAAWGSFEVFNPRLPNLLVGLMGFKAYFFYVPLLVVVPACFRRDEELVAFLRKYTLLLIPIGLIALVQFRSPADSFVNTYGRAVEEGQQSAITFGTSEHVRVTATFSFITGYTSYLVASIVLLLALLGGARWAILRNRALFVALGFGVLGMFMTGSRAPIATVALLFPLYWYLAIMREGDAGATLSRAVLLIAFASVVIGVFGASEVTAFVGRASTGSDTSERLSSLYLSPWEILPEAGVIGYGIGATHQSATTLAPSIIPYSWLHGLNTEVETGRIMLELGLVGFLLMFTLRLSLILIAYVLASSLRTRFHRALAIGSFLFFVAEFVGTPVFDVTCGVYYWFFVGLMMLAARLDRDAVAAAHMAQPATARDRRVAAPPRSLPTGWQTPPAPQS